MTSRHPASGKLCILSCHSFHQEIAAAIALEGWPDITSSAFPVRCGHPPASWDELRPLIDKDCTQVVLLGIACIATLGAPPDDWPPVRLIHPDQCFHLVADTNLVNDAIERGAYLITPAWLGNWRNILTKMGFTTKSSRDFFHDFARELVFLDTNIDPQAGQNLAKLASTLNLPASRIPIGLDHTRLYLSKIVLEWRLEEAQRASLATEQQKTQELADRTFAIDSLSRLTQIQSEAEVIDFIENLFRMLFAPKNVYYLRVENETITPTHPIPEELLTRVQTLDNDYAWTPDNLGFLLRITRGKQIVGLVAIDQLAFPQYCQRYLNLALAITNICAIAIENARTYQHLKTTEDSLIKSNERLKLATLYNGVGIWDWNLDTQELIWDDSMYQLFQVHSTDFSSPQAVLKACVHPDDSARRKQELVQAISNQKPYDTEFRIRWPNGEVRYIKAIATVIYDQSGKPYRMLGANTDSTERKALESELERQAHIDYLTNVSNRRHFMEQADLERNRALRYDYALSLFMLDIDYFKQINDRYGHQAGDTALKNLTAICRQTLREVDIIGRLGGEEFAILLPETNMIEASEVAERLRGAIAETIIALDDGTSLQLTVSIGVTSMTSAEDTLDSLLISADQALYSAKETGRNKICVANI